MDLLEQIKKHAEAVVPKECCGLVVIGDNNTLSIIECENTSEKPEKYFRIDPVKYLEIYRTGKLYGYYHSHPTEPNDFSEADMAIAEATQLPLYLFCNITGELKLYTPEGKKTPLEGRKFVPDVFDCWGLVHDYYKDVCDITLPFFSRDSGEKKWSQNIRQYIEEVGAKIVTNPQLHDVIIMNVSSRYPNHAGIYLDHGIILHQRANDVSRRDVYGGYWKTATVMILRHPKFLK